MNSSDWQQTGAEPTEQPAVFAVYASLREWAGLGFALFGLNFALSFHNLWPTPWITTHHEISIEIAILIFMVWWWAGRGRRVPRWLLTLLTVVLTFMTIGHYAEVTAPALYGRAINIYWDAQFLPHVAEMLIESAHPLLATGLLAGVILAMVGLYLLLQLALKRVIVACKRPYEKHITGLLAGLLVGLYLAGFAGVPVNKLQLYSLPVSSMLRQQAGFLSAALGADATLDHLTQDKPLGDFALPVLGNADVLLQFIESYGAVAFDAPEIATMIAASRNDLARAIAQTNRRVVSAYFESPTFGGGSWLSHSSVMTGLDINDNGTYNLLLTRSVPTLSSRFSGLGYRSVALMPGLKSEWPEGRFYHFDRIYGSRELDYRGPEFGWWAIPDQFSLARLVKEELDMPGRRPLFIMFTAISSHMPFRPTPPYQPDWSRMLSGHPYDEEVTRDALALLPEWTNMRPSYAGTLVYTFEYLAGFLREQVDRNFLWVLIGDHQPAASVSGAHARRDAPVHIISTNDQLIEALLHSGFVEGLTPRDTPLGPMHELSPMLLNALRD